MATTRPMTKGVLLAGGSGSRLYPITRSVNKHLLPVFDKPMVYYPLSVLMLAGIREILVVTTPCDIAPFQSLLGDGSRLGISIHYAPQSQPRGLADALLAGRDFIGTDPVCLALGDNILYGEGLTGILAGAADGALGATVFGYPVHEAQRFGVIQLDARGRVISVAEKPACPQSNLAIPGFYFYDGRAVELAESLCPSERGELEITDLNQAYLDRGELRCHVLGRGFTWLDAGTPEALVEASRFVETLQRRQGLKIACLEEIAASRKFITPAQLQRLAGTMPGEYGKYVLERARALADSG